MYTKDNRTVVTLDAGGTNFVFDAIKGYKSILEPVRLPAHASRLDKCMESLVEGFARVIGQLDEKPVAISFGFPGPADYPRGVIGGYLTNFPSFRDGVALGPFLEDKFGVPVFINNDADLYAYGEAIAGALPDINARLREAGSTRQYHNLIGYTLGTGFGIGIVSGGRLHIGDNSCVETYCLPHKKMRDVIVEEGVSIRAVKRVYGELSGETGHAYEPKDLYEIACGTRPGNREAAIGSFREMGEILGDAVATAAPLIDGLIVIGGGLAAAAEFFIPAMLNEMRSRLHTLGGDALPRVPSKVYNLDNPAEFCDFACDELREIKVYGSDRTVAYNPQKKTGVTVSKIGANRAVWLGAYAYALNRIDCR